MEQKKLKAVMAEKKVTGYQLAKQTGIQDTHIYRIMNGKQEAFPKYKRLIADALGVDETELFDD